MAHVLRCTFYVAIALIAAFPLWGPGIVNTRGGGDSPFLLQRTMDMADNLRYGIFPPRWMAHAAYDLGYPLFNHYAALPYYLSGSLAALGLSPILAIQATQTFGFVLAALTMGLWAQRIFRQHAAVLLATVAYTFAPFHMVNIYIRGDSLSAFYAFIWYPLILWAIDRMVERPTRRHIAVASLAYTMLILTHNVSLLIFSPFALLYALLRQFFRTRARHTAIPRRKWLRALGLALLPFIMGFLLAAWFWVPAVGEIAYGQMGSEFTEGYFHYSKHFRGWNLVQPTPYFNYSIAGRTEDAGPFAMGLVQAVLTLVGLAFLARNSRLNLTQRRNKKQPQATMPSQPAVRISYLYILFGLLLSTLMITPLSRLLWQHIPMLATTQFPWRFLSVQALFTSITIGALLDGEGKRCHTVGPFEMRSLFAICLGAIIVLSALLGLQPDRLLITDEDVTWENLLLYETFTGNIGTTIRYEYLPQNVVPRPYISEAVIDGQGYLITDGDTLISSTLVSRTPVSQVWEVLLKADSTPVTFPCHWWPGWHATVDGQRTNTYPMPGSGRLTVDLNEGAHVVTLRLGNTPLRTIATLISGLTGLGGIIFLIGEWKRNRGAKTQGSGWCRRFGFVSLSIFVALLLSLGLPALFGRASVKQDLSTFDFVQMPYTHHGPMNFGAVELKQAKLFQTVAQPGDTLTVSLAWSWSASAPLTATVSIVSPAEPRHGVSYQLAQTTFRLICKEDKIQPSDICDASAQIIIPQDIARGLYLVALDLRDAMGEISPQTAQGRGTGQLYIGTLRVPEGPMVQMDAPCLAAFQDLCLHEVTTEQPDPTRLKLKMAWSTPGTARNWTLSLRLLDAEGRQLVQRDLQPGYGYLPTTLWRPGELVVDYPELLLPEGLAPGNYTLQVITYLRATMAGGGQTEIPIRLTESTLYDPRSGCCEQERKGAAVLCSAAGVNLSGLDLPDILHEGYDLDFHAEWNVIALPMRDLTARWSVLDANGTPIVQREGPLAPGSNSLDWPRLAWVRVPVHLDLPTSMPNTPYTLQLTMLVDNTVLSTCDLPMELPLIPRPRVFSVGDLPESQLVDFGDELRLLGYALEQTRDTLSLTLWWQAQRLPTRDYMRFVHLYNPQTEEIVGQEDAMPRAWTYPTSQWLAEEIVSETITLDLTATPMGEYRIGLGWYDPETVIRLPARDQHGDTLPMDRVTLPDSVNRKK